MSRTKKKKTSRAIEKVPAPSGPISVLPLRMGLKSDGDTSPNMKKRPPVRPLSKDDQEKAAAVYFSHAHLFGA